jgi:hypothetical protein
MVSRRRRFAYPMLAPLALTLSACSTAPRDDSAYLTRLLVGSWIAEDDDPDCPGRALYKFRSDGKYTVTHESCDIVSDGFGIFRYGWYISKNHLCFVHLDESASAQVQRPRHFRARYLDRVRLGFVEEQCQWRVEQVTARAVRLVPPQSELRPSLLQRARW